MSSSSNTIIIKWKSDKCLVPKSKFEKKKKKHGDFAQNNDK